ncbi:hypothetical protein EGW08_012495 [Elysia chlorotica]|uniref:Uncharacterized protein n=1 Tax=Elysia chlorotica TaxID=188477 RepID=A0A433TE00_ELYCH|nr:hypothetical protein EGW08_012495 [Elysia chlorotica]
MYCKIFNHTTSKKNSHGGEKQTTAKTWKEETNMYGKRSLKRPTNCNVKNREWSRQTNYSRNVVWRDGQTSANMWLYKTKKWSKNVADETNYSKTCMEEKDKTTLKCGLARWRNFSKNVVVFWQTASKTWFGKVDKLEHKTWLENTNNLQQKRHG